MAVQVVGKVSFFQETDNRKQSVSVRVEGEGETSGEALRAGVAEFLTPGENACDAIDEALRQCREEPDNA